MSGRVLALDLGTKRVGVAVSDPTATLASPTATIERTGDERRDRDRIATMVAEEEAALVLVGLPLNMDGSSGPAARAAEAEADALASAVGVPVVLVDERLTTVTADRALLARGLRAPQRRRIVDQTAAAVLLQAWLDGAEGARWRADPRARTGDHPPSGHHIPPAGSHVPPAGSHVPPAGSHVPPAGSRGDSVV